MSFFTYRIHRVWPTFEGPTSAKTRYIPEFSADSGVTFRPCYPGDQPQALLEAQMRLTEITSAENTFRDKVANGLLGTLDDFVSFP
jgi:hypothetical protein